MKHAWRPWLCLLPAALLLIAPAHRASAMDNAYVGFNEHPERYATTYSTLLDQLGQSQVKWVRLAPEWGQFQPNAPTATSDGYDTAFLTRMDDIVNQLTSKGIQIDFVLCYSSQWASSAPANLTYTERAFYPPTPEHMVDWANYVHFLAARYQNKITTWEVWNEPDHPKFLTPATTDTTAPNYVPTYETYKTILHNAHDQLKAVNPSNTVLLGGLATNDGKNDNYGIGSWFDHLMSLGAAPDFDVINYHAYGSSASMVSRYNGMMDVVRQYPALADKPIWLTETGFETKTITTETQAQKADYADQIYALYKRLPNIQRVFWYDFRDDNETGGGYGLESHASDFSPYKAYYHAQALGEADAVFDSSLPALATTLSLVPADAAPATPLLPDPDRSVYTVDGTTATLPSNSSLYLQVNDNWLYDTNDGLDPTAYVDITYYDSGLDTFQLQYDGQSSPYQTISIPKTNTLAWKTQTFALSDLQFANREAHAADFRLVAGEGDLVVSKIAVRKQDQIAKINLNSQNEFKLMNMVTTSDATQNEQVTYYGRECRKIADNNHYLFFDVADGIAGINDHTITIGVTYFDEGTDSLLIQYNGWNATEPYSTAENDRYRLAPAIKKTNTKTWKRAEVTLTDAAFRTSQFGSIADFRIGNNGDNSVEYIAAVDVTRK